jgi:hypothetical protein
MPHLTLVLMIVGAFVIALGMFIDVKAHLGNRSEEMAPFRYYFGTEDDRDLLRQRSWYDCENHSESRTRFEAFSAGHSGATERYSRAVGTIRRNRDPL